MNKQMLEVRQRRGELQAKITAQRKQMADIGATWQTPLALADRGLVIARFLRSHPALPLGVAALFVFYQRGMFGLAKLGWRVWKNYRFFHALSEKLSARNPERS